MADASSGLERRQLSVAERIQIRRDLANELAQRAKRMLGVDGAEPSCQPAGSATHKNMCPGSVFLGTATPSGGPKRQKLQAPLKKAPSSAVAAINKEPAAGKKAIRRRKKCTQLAGVQHICGTGMMRVSLPDKQQVVVTIAAMDEASGYAVGVYTDVKDGVAPVCGAVAMPIGLVSEQCQRELKQRRRMLNARSTAFHTSGARALHIPAHFEAHAGELGLVIRGSATTTPTTDTTQIAAPTLIGYTCDSALQATLCEQVFFHDKWEARAFWVRTQALGVEGKAACLAQMERVHRSVEGARRIALLDENGAFDQRNTRLRVVREALFGSTTCLGYGNVWSQALKSRDKLFYALNAPPEPTVAEQRVVTSLRGLLGQPLGHTAAPSLRELLRQAHCVPGTLTEPPRRKKKQ